MIEINEANKGVLLAIGAPIGFDYRISKFESQQQQDRFNSYGNAFVSPSIVVWCYARVLMNNDNQKKCFIKGLLALLEKEDQLDVQDIRSGSALHLQALEKRARAKGGDIKKALHSSIYRGYSCIAGICAGVEKVIIADNAHQFVQLYDTCPHREPYDGGYNLTPNQIQENNKLSNLWDKFYLPILADFRDFLSDNNFSNIYDKGGI
jgi:hypothetical protein